MIQYNQLENLFFKCVPGPGKYEQKRLFDDSNSKQGDLLGVEIERPPFGTQAKVLMIIQNKILIYFI